MPNGHALSRIISPASLVLIVLAVAVGGCRTPQFRANAMPRDMLARPVIDPASIEIGRISGGGVNSQAIGQGDLLTVRASTGIETEDVPTWHVRVDDNGNAPVPMIGAVNVLGMDTVGAEDAVRKASIERKIYRNPSISIAIEQRKTYRVFVGGAVLTPGKYELPAANCDLRSALLAAGGLDESADPVVEIHRPGPNGATLVAEKVDLVTATQQGNGGGKLADGTVVTVGKLPPRKIHVFGLVNKPNSFDIPAGQDMRMLDAIAAAGGPKLSVADKVFIVRKTPGGSDSVLMESSIGEAKENSAANPLLAHGDTVIVEETPTTYIVGALERFIRVGVGFSPSIGF